MGDATSLISLDIKTIKSLILSIKMDHRYGWEISTVPHIFLEIMESLIILKTNENEKVSDMFSIIKSNNSNFLN